MARIPVRTAERSLPAGPNQLPGVRLTAAPTAADLGGNAQVRNEGAMRDIRSASQHFTDAMEVIERRRDQTAVLATEAEARKTLSAYAAELEQQVGMHAAGATERAKTFLGEAKERMHGRLANSRQQRAFDEIWSRLEVSTIDAASRHEAREGQRAKADAAGAAVAGAIEWASRHADDPNAVANSRAEVIERTGLLANAKGLPPEARAVELVKNLSAMHEQVVNAKLTRGDVQGAQAYYDAHAVGEMTSSTRDRLGETLKTAGSVERAQRFADETGNMSEADAIAKARKELSGDDETRAVAEIKTRHAEINAARERQQRAAADQAWAIYARSNNPNAIPPDVVARMDARDVLAIQRSHEQKLATAESRAAARASRAAAVETRAAAVEAREDAARNRNRAGTYYDLRSLAMQDPQAFAQLDLRRYSPELGSAQMESLIDIQAQASKPVPNDPTALDLRTYLQQVRQMTEKLALDKEETAAFEERADQAVRAAQLRAGKRLSEQERQAVLDKLVVDAAVPGRLWGERQVPTWQVTEDQARELATDRGVPAEATIAIIAGLKRRGIPVTGEAIERVYRSANPQPTAATTR